MSFKTFKRAILGPGEFEKILLAEQEVFNDIQLYQDPTVIKEKLRKIKFQLEDVAGRTSDKNTQKYQYLQNIFLGLEAIADGKTYKGYNLEKLGEELSARRNLSNTTTRSRKLLENVATYSKNLNKKTKEIEMAKIQQLSERPEKNREMARKIGKRVLAAMKMPQKNSYTNAEGKAIREYTRLREIAKKQMGIKEEQINDNPDFEEFLSIRVKALSSAQPTATARTTTPGAGTGLKGGRKTRKQRRGRKARKGKSKSRKN